MHSLLIVYLLRFRRRLVTTTEENDLELIESYERDVRAGVDDEVTEERLFHI